MKKSQFYSIITDCIDSNAVARQEMHAQILFPDSSPTITHVESVTALAGNIIDLVSVAEHAGGVGVIIGNRAPRAEAQGVYENGAPFVYAWRNDILLVVTYSEELHAILKEFLDIDTWYLPSEVMRDEIYETYSVDPTTQFRSLYYAPCLAHYVMHNPDAKGDSIEHGELPEVAPWTVWHVDNFGNLKTFATLRNYEQQALAINGAVAPLVERLKDAPENHLVVIEGSSGFQGSKFLEVVVQGGSAADRLGRGIGNKLDQ